MAYRTRVFVDFWNFQLQWNSLREDDSRCDWPRMPAVLLERAGQVLSRAGVREPLQLEEARVYASYDADPRSATDARLRDWLANFLDRQPGFRVFAKERVRRSRAVKCRNCGVVFTDCPNCHQPLRGSQEKGVDTAIVTDLLSLAWEAAYDVAILVSSDADMVPCVQRIQEKGLKVVNAAWRGRGNALARACWASFYIEDVAHGLVRQED